MAKILREELYRIIQSNSKDSSQYLVAKEILYQLNLGEQLNISEIAKNCFSSKPTVTRFAQSLGFDGFKDFVKELKRQDVEYYYNSDFKDYNNIFNNYRFLISDLLKNLDSEKEVLVEVVKKIQETKRMFIFSSHEHSLLLAEFANKTGFLGIQVFWASKNQNFLATNLKENDLVFFLTSWMDNLALLNLWNTLNEKNVRVLVAFPHQLIKFPNPSYVISTNIKPNLLQQQLKDFLMQYILDQIYNLLLYSDKNFANILKQENLKQEI